MSRLRNILPGERFGKLITIEPAGKRHGSVLWKCRCNCGNETEVANYRLVSGYTKSCGCLRREITIERLTTHGMSKTNIYKTWHTMRERCSNPNVKNYPGYGGRGITVCDEWATFQLFYNWATANGYESHLSIDRVNNDGNYESGNCKWSTMKEQQNNRRDNVWYEYNGYKKTMKQWSDFIGISPSLISWRVRKGWSFEKALLTPVRIQKNNKKKENNNGQ